MQSPDRALFISQHGLCHQTVYGIPVVVTKTRVLVTLNWTPEPHHQSCRPPPSRPRHRRSLKVLIGCALFLAPVLKFLPRAVLQGVFFYMGIASLTGEALGWEGLVDGFGLCGLKVDWHGHVSFLLGGGALREERLRIACN